MIWNPWFFLCGYFFVVGVFFGGHLGALVSEARIMPLNQIFMGYILFLGQMNLWGITIIPIILSPFLSLIEWFCGGYYIYNLLLKRFFVFHFLFLFLLYAFLLFHIFNLHFLFSNNPLRSSTNNKIVFFLFITSKEFYGKILILYLYLLQIHFGFSSFSYPDNVLEVCGLRTLLYIIFEWYFLC